MLYIVATPIGNLEDITLRAISVLKSVDFILSEDTRVTKKLLNHFEIQTNLISFHEYSDENKYEKISELLAEGKSLALVTDAGTPAISDPGYFLVKKIRQEMPEIKIVAIPGPSALTAAISISGINAREFTFLGFPPHKKGRKTFFEKVARISAENPVIFYESTHRLIKALESLLEIIPEKKVVVAKELTKMFEEIITGKPNEIISYLHKYSEKIKGEFVIIVE
jgi:16S rRNA (cytidine1402-2'-O)-methyltransferase